MKATSFHSGMHLEEDQVLPPEPECPLCLFRGKRSPVFQLQSGPDVFLLACPTCRGFSASRLPTSDALRVYYSQYYQQDVFHEIQNVTFHEPRRFATHVLRKAKPFLPERQVKILDFGGGAGDLSLAIARLLLEGGASHAQVVLVDYNASLAGARFQNIALECHEDLDSARVENCDLVLASGILEHIPHPQTDFARLLLALRPGGLFYARTPSVAPLFRVLQRVGLPLDFTYPAHVHDMGEAYWSNILGLLPPSLRDYSIICSRPSIVETTLRRDLIRTVAAHGMKFPWRIFGSRYPFVGGWEVFIRRPIAA
ncbi:MAG: class I SAM-dependent methyltransferase [Terriglobales bacterium]